MLLRGEARNHSHDDVVTFCEGHVLVGEVMVRLGEDRGDYLRSAATKHETEESLSRFVEVAGKLQTFIERGFSGPQNYRVPIHIVFLSRTLYILNSDIGYDRELCEVSDTPAEF